MNGAESLVRTLHCAGIEVCFANPGTSEMMFVDALDRTGLIRCVLALFEGVASGAADGYARMALKPAATLLHLGPGFANASANLHNARRARSPVVNLVGEHALRHLPHDAPLATDLATVVAPFSDWVRATTTAAGMGADGAAAVAAARSWPNRVATLLAPGCAGWDEGGVIARPLAPEQPAPLEGADVEAAAAMLGPDCVLLVGGSALWDPAALALAAGVAATSGATLMIPTSNRRVERGAGGVALERVPYPVDAAVARLAGFRRAVLVETVPPVGFFAYPGKPSLMLGPDCATLTLASRAQDGRAALAALAARLGAGPAAPLAGRRAAAPDAGELTPQSLGAAIAAAMPDGAIVVDESITASGALWAATEAAPRHSWIALTGGAIGDGLPMATGAAVACPGRPVITLQADGSAMYTIQALWTQARERLDVKTVILANRGYEILKQELYRVGANPGPAALDMLEMTRPEVDFVALARGMGVDGARVGCARALAETLTDSLRRPGPFVIEARMT